VPDNHLAEVTAQRIHLGRWNQSHT